MWEAQPLATLRAYTGITLPLIDNCCLRKQYVTYIVWAKCRVSNVKVVITEISRVNCGAWVSLLQRGDARNAPTGQQPCFMDLSLTSELLLAARCHQGCQPCYVTSRKSQWNSARNFDIFAQVQRTRKYYVTVWIVWKIFMWIQSRTRCGRSLDGSVGVPKSYELGGQCSIRGRGKIFLFSIASNPVLVPTQPPIQWFPPRVKRPGREADRSLPSSSVGKYFGAIHLLPHTSS
jgi:hypothetical protein